MFSFIATINYKHKPFKMCLVTTYYKYVVDIDGVLRNNNYIPNISFGINHVVIKKMVPIS